MRWSRRESWRQVRLESGLALDASPYSEVYGRAERYGDSSNGNTERSSGGEWGNSSSNSSSSSSNSSNSNSNSICSSDAATWQPGPEQEQGQEHAGWDVVKIALQLYKVR